MTHTKMTAERQAELRNCVEKFWTSSLGDRSETARVVSECLDGIAALEALRSAPSISEIVDSDGSVDEGMYVDWHAGPRASIIAENDTPKRTDTDPPAPSAKAECVHCNLKLRAEYYAKNGTYASVPWCTCGASEAK